MSGHGSENTTGHAIASSPPLRAWERLWSTVSIALLAFFFMSASADGRIIINEVNMGSQDYFEIFNYDLSPVDLTGYTAEFWDSGLGPFNPLPVIGFPSLTLAANSLLTFHENANVAAGEIDTPPLFMWHGRDLSIVIRDGNGDIVDLWAHGNTFFGPPDADPATVPINTINSNTDSTTYQRFAVQSGTDFSASDWGASPESRNAFNASQMIAVPEPTTWALTLTGLIGALGMTIRSRWNMESDVTRSAIGSDASMPSDSPAKASNESIPASRTI